MFRLLYWDFFSIQKYSRPLQPGLWECNSVYLSFLEAGRVLWNRCLTSHERSTLDFTIEDIRRKFMFLTNRFELVFSLHNNIMVIMTSWWFLSEFKDSTWMPPRKPRTVSNRKHLQTLGLKSPEICWCKSTQVFLRVSLAVSEHSWSCSSDNCYSGSSRIWHWSLSPSPQK